MSTTSPEPPKPREIVCLCGASFTYIPKRGRPPVRCDDCREAYANGMIRDRLASLGIDPDLAIRKRIDSRPTSTPRREINSPESGDEIEEVDDVSKSIAKVDRLEFKLKLAGLHISQHRDKW